MFWSWHTFTQELVNTGYLHAAWATLWSATVVELAAAIGGFGLALLMRTQIWFLRAIVGVYVWVWRGTPLLGQLLLVYFGLPELGIRLGVISSGVTTLILNESAYMAVLAAATIESVPAGQYDACKVLGLSRWTRFRAVVFPQAFRLFIPVLGNQYNYMLKTTSLLSIISFTELTQFSETRLNVTYQPTEVFAVACLYYLAMSILWGIVQHLLDRHFSATTRPTNRALRRLLLPRAELAPLPPTDTPVVDRTVSEGEGRTVSETTP